MKQFLFRWLIIFVLLLVAIGVLVVLSLAGAWLFRTTGRSPVVIGVYLVGLMSLVLALIGEERG